MKKELPDKVRKIASKSFHGKKLTRREKAILRYYVDSGRYII